MNSEINRNALISTIAREVYELDNIPFTRLGSFESEIWEVSKQHVSYILRVTDSFHRTLPELLSEASWIKFLDTKGIPTVKIVPTVNGNDCFSIHDPEVFLMLFSKAKGNGPTKNDITEKLLEQWGYIVGSMHRLSLEFLPDDTFMRSYTENILTSHFNKVSNKIEPVIQKKYSEILKKSMGFPVSRKHYGLIHSDLHLGNFFLDQGKMTIFDFDDLQLGWFVFDIAIALYYIFWNDDLKEPTWYQNAKVRTEQAIYFIQQFIKGYQQEFKLPKEWLTMIPVFLELRQLDLYLVFEDRFSEIVDENSIPFKLIHQYKQRIMNHIPPVPLDVFKKEWYKLR